MIVKKIKNPRKSASKAARVGGLADYILSPEKDNANEKCIYAGARGFLTDEPSSQKAEMLALAQEAVRSKDPINHYVLSWREGEQPSAAQVEQAVDIFLGELGLADHQVIYGLHADTDNIHLHVAVNRVHPQTLKVIKPNKGFDIEAAHRAVARIEHVQGWKREQNARYQVLENDELGRAVPDPDRPRQPDQPKRDMEQRTGEKSAERIAIEDGAPLIQRATSWAQLHRDLAAKGMRYEKVGSGAKLFVGDVGVKASSAHRDASLSKLQERLGVYEPAPVRQRVAERAPEPVHRDVPGWSAYIEKRKAHYAAKGEATLAQSRREDGERRALAEQQKVQRAEVLKGNHRGKGDLRNALQSVLAVEQATEKAALKARHQQERLRLRERFRPYPDLEQWQRLQQRPELAEDWRRRASAPQRMVGATLGLAEPPTIRALGRFVAEIHGQEVHYFRRRDADVGVVPAAPVAEAGGGSSKGEVAFEGRDEVASFVDKGRIVEIHDWRDRETTLAALQLSAQKWGRFEVLGNDEYKALCVSLAVEHGFDVTNAELQERIQAGRQLAQQVRQQQLEAERAQALKSEALRQFEAYHRAVGAERYRVTLVRLEPGGGRTTFMPDGMGGSGAGSSPEDVARRVSDLERLQGRGESVHYTPLSGDKHHLAIDGMDAEKLGRLVRDGYRPAAVLEVASGRYQAILNVRKLPAPAGIDVGARLAAQLNREYGDATLSGGEKAGGAPASGAATGGTQAHPAPGYERRGPGQAEGGGGFVVRLHQAEGRECMATLTLEALLLSQHRQEVAKKRVPEAGGVGMSASMPANALAGPADAYRRHYGDVLKRQQGGKVDLSRVDSMIAVRMRVTGHSQGDVEAALRQCAPGIRPPGEVRDWNDYAQRTARYAYSPAGERQAQELGKYRERWERLEGRAPAPERAPSREPEKQIEQKRQRGPRLGM